MSINSPNWIWNPFAVVPADASILLYSHRIPYCPIDAFDDSIADPPEFAFVRGEGANLLFFPVVEGTITPYVPTELESQSDWKVTLNGFGLESALEFTSADSSLQVNLTTGEILAKVTATHTLSMVANRRGTVSLTRVGPDDDQKMRMRLVRSYVVG